MLYDSAPAPLKCAPHHASGECFAMAPSCLGLDPSRRWCAPQGHCGQAQGPGLAGGGAVIRGGEGDVDDRHVGLVLLDGAQEQRRVARLREDLYAGPPEEIGERLADQGPVADQLARGLANARRVTAKVPGRGAAQGNCNPAVPAGLGGRRPGFLNSILMRKLCAIRVMHAHVQ
jgi:hypothetical protein